nr:dehydration-responsive element-binding protein DREB2 [Ipomoea trifida]
MAAGGGDGVGASICSRGRGAEKKKRGPKQKNPYKGIPKLNFPDYVVGDGHHRQLVPKEIQDRATAVGYRIDAIQRGLHISSAQMSVNVVDHHPDSHVYVTPDLNKYPHLD